MNARLSAVSTASVDAPWFHYWVDHPTITFQRTFAEGGKNMHKPDQTPGILRLVPRLGHKKELIGFSVEPRESEFPLTWRGVSLVPMGHDPILPTGTLPVWSSDQNLTYADALAPLVSAMHSPVTRLQRLEGFFPVTDEASGSFNIDRIRILLIPQIVLNKEDLALAVLTLVESHGLVSKQNGGGSGPPN